jgi:hypothetical protein
MTRQEIPLIEEKEGFVKPDLTGNVFKEHVLFGLLIAKNIAQFISVLTPNIDEVVRWMQSYGEVEWIKDGRINWHAPLDQTGIPMRYGMKLMDQLLRISNFAVHSL